MTAVFAVGYLAFSVPALIACVATTKYGLHATARLYSASLAALVAVAAGHPGVPPRAPARASLAPRDATGPVHESAVPAGHGRSGPAGRRGT